MSACSIIRAGRSAYPSGMRRLILIVAVVAIVGLVIYRKQAIDQSQQELANGANGTDTPT